MENAQSDDPTGESNGNGLKSKATAKVRKLSVAAKENAEERVREIGTVAKTRATGKVRDISTAAKAKAEGRVRDLSSVAKQRAGEQIEGGRERIASRIDDAASGLMQHAEQTTHLRQEAERRVARQMEVTAQYLHEHQTQEVASDLSALVRQHPIRSIVIAAVLGFLLARILR